MASASERSYTRRDTVLFLVCLGLSLFGLFSPTPGQEENIRRGQQEFTGVVEAIQRENVGRFAGDRKLFNLILGDVCHAYHGLAMIKGLNQA